ncbi:hypothetical protein ONS95_004248 [Cadophora gregata]|uniref:uncharacterized protein n=1 Tax=Cadophora gregata TaxID=51156 RepID=UPI0026DD9596|nr:uncharacterized protein ONS95_004248 [Cadophora gregata]KAK0105376.1 hypothetical protein ONS96_004768 [Cadophora gregata f. sp. sojae]KAK0105727.1 hypothetical protein ONS95_004248 [Cadophora gregata]
MEHPINILLIGKGGRESALAHKLSQSPRVAKVFVAPGNGGTASGISKVSNVDNIQEDDFLGLVKVAKELGVHLVVPGPDGPVVGGIEGYFRQANIPCFAPSKETAQIEGSKAFSKDFMARHNIPTARYCNFRNYHEAKRFIESNDYNVVIKASGLAAGKGVIIPRNKQEAVDALKLVMIDRQFGDAGDEVVIEEFLEGDEMSILTFSDGNSFKSMLPAQDHKRIFDGDQGPNTGGMGCYAPTKIATAAVLRDIDNLILKPTFDGLRQEGIPFVGMLFTGIMLTKDGPKTLEYNARFGDPETQTLLPLLNSDLAEIMTACVNGRLHEIDVEMESKFSAVVIASAAGYPGSYSNGKTIRMNHHHIAKAGDGNITFFHAGTKLREDGDLLTSGGRVIAVSATADSLEEAVKRAYQGVSMVEFEGMHFRKDIAYRALR